MLLQQLVGITAVAAYAGSIFEEAGEFDMWLYSLLFDPSSQPLYNTQHNKIVY